MRIFAVAIAAFVLPTAASTGYTRPGYVDGCQSPDGRYVATAAPKRDEKKRDGWEFTWTDTKTKETHTGRLVGVPQGLEHFRVAYTHIFVPPGGETFAVWQPASWAPASGKPPGGDKALNKNPDDDFKAYPGFGDRLVIYKKTGEVVKRLTMNDILKADEWIYVNWVQGNLYWLSEYPDVMKEGEPPRCGYRYFRVSPDYTVLEFTVGPNSDARNRVKGEGAEVVNYRRAVTLSLIDGSFLDGVPTDKAKIPVRPFVGATVKRGDEMKSFVPSLDPVRIAGKVDAPPMK